MPEPQNAIEKNLTEAKIKPKCLPASSPKWPLVTEDYHGALVRLTTMRATKIQYFVVQHCGAVSARHTAATFLHRPQETLVSSWLWRRRYLGGVRIGDACCRCTCVVRRGGPWAGDHSPAFGGLDCLVLLRAEPAFGRFCVGGDVPFAQQWHSVPRIHRLVPMDDPPKLSTSLEKAFMPASGLP